MLTLNGAESLKQKELSSATAADPESSDDPHADAYSCSCRIAFSSRALLLVSASHSPSIANGTAEELCWPE
jgi:hypothetical protein